MITEIDVKDVNGNIVDEVVQWDQNIYLYTDAVSQLYDVHFHTYDGKTSYIADSVSYSSSTGLKFMIPNILMEQTDQIHGYIYVSQDGGYWSIYHFKLRMRKKPKPDTYTDSTDQYNSITDLMRRVTNLEAEMAMILG